jgi:RNA polymerase sigma factor (sigma-70 family)
MQPRKDVVAIFSTFLRLEADRTAGWISELRLRRRMVELQDRVPDRSVLDWSLYWHEIWQVDKNPSAESHLTAYLQETCYWVARRMANNQRNLSWLADFFQTAIVRVPRLLNCFKPEYNASLKKYAELGFENSLKDWLRLQQQVEVCSDWTLLHRLSRRRLHNALTQAGWNVTSISQYTLAWDCYQELATIKPQGRPTDDIWTAIAQAYNHDRLTQVGPGTAIATAAQLEQWLLICAKSVRQLLKPTILSADAPFSDDSSIQALDIIADPQGSPMDQWIIEEEEAARSQQHQQFQIILTEAIDRLSTPEKRLLQDYYRDKMTQSDMAKKLGIQQYQVSRQLERVRRSILKKIILWVQKNLHTSPTPSVVESMGHSLDVWLKDYGRSEP